MKHRLLISFFFIAQLLFPCASTAGEPVTATYDTYLPANKLLPTLESLLSPADKITGYGNKLFVKAPPSTQQTIEQVLAEVDRLPRNISIAIRYREGHYASEKSQHSKVKVFTGSSQRTTIDINEVESYRLSTNKGDYDQSIRVLEGTSARLNLGKEYPDQNWLFVTPMSGGFQTTSRNLGQEIMATPTITSGLIRLQIYTANRKQSPQQNFTKNTEVDVTVLLEPGLWTPLASSNQVQDRNNAAYSISTRNDNSLRIDIRADILE